MKRGIRCGLVVGLAGVLVIALAGLAGGKIKTKTFSSGTINEEFGDGETAAHDFSLTQKRFKRSKVKDVDASVRITSNCSEPHRITLTGPTGREVELSSNNPFAMCAPGYGSGSEGCSGTLTRFNDEAETPVTEGAAPFNGQFTPEERLSELDGTKVKGTWRLAVTDTDGFGDASALHCAELKVKYKKKKKH